MNTQNKYNQYIVAFQYLKPSGEWSKYYPLEDYCNIDKNNRVIGLMLVDLLTANEHSLKLAEYYNSIPENKNTEFKFYPAKFDLTKQSVVTIHEYKRGNHEH